MELNIISNCKQFNLKWSSYATVLVKYWENHIFKHVAVQAPRLCCIVPKRGDSSLAIDIADKLFQIFCRPWTISPDLYSMDAAATMVEASHIFPIILHCVINQFCWLRRPLHPLPHTPWLPLNLKQLTNISSDPLNGLSNAGRFFFAWSPMVTLQVSHEHIAKVRTQILSSPWREEYTEPIFSLFASPGPRTPATVRMDFSSTSLSRLRSRRRDSQTNSRTSGSC